MRHERVAPRVLGVTVRVRGVQGDVRLACIHGVHDPHIFQRQWADGEQWVARGAGMLCGDLNHVPCMAWRVNNRSLDWADKAIRLTLGHTCDCCSTAMDSEENRVLLLVPAPRDAAHGHWTHYFTSQGLWGEPNARYDFAIRATEAPAWKGVASLPVEGVGEDGVGHPLSDHLWQVVEARIGCPKDLRKKRPLAPNFGGAAGEALLREITEELADGADAAARIDDTVAAARATGQPATDAVVQAVMNALRRAQWRVRVLRKDGRARAQRAAASPASPACLFATWRARLRQACAARSCGIPAASARHLACLHPMTGLRKYISGEDNGWQLIIRRCRHEANRAARALHMQEDMRDAWTCAMARKAQRLQRTNPDDAQQLYRIAAGIVRGPRASVAFEEFHVADDPAGRTVHAMENEASEVAADIGRRCVQALDEGAVPPAYQALTDKYAGNWPQLDSRHGGEFALSRDLSFDDFQAVLAGLPSKAVGASGFALRLIQAAGSRVQKALFDALISDVCQRVLSARWREVILVLLPKPPPNRADIVRECREIALMEHDVKALLLMVRRECLSRVIGRVNKIQPGWVPGYGCDNQGVASAFVTDSEHRLRRPLWMLYVDLSQFFPRISRECLTIADISKGLPEEIVWLANAIYHCRYDSTGGLCGSFDYDVGVLMGGPLSTDQARIFLDAIVCAIAAAARGVRLWGSKRDVAQLLCADDWLGVFNDITHLRTAWGWWRLWEPMAGAKLGMSSKGVRIADKTIVTGIAYDDKGTSRDIIDPRLRTVDGRYVPVRPRTHAYKHLGRWRRADASRVDGLKQFDKRVRAGVQRLRRLRHPTPHTFLLISEAILGGYAGFYLQDLYLTFREADKLEGSWRASFNKIAHRHASTPRADLYDTQFRAGSSRRHLWAHGLRATYASVNAMLADAEDMEHRAAARSGVSLSLYLWGCRQDPRTWDWTHLRGALEAHLESTKHRYVGDVWLLAWAVLMAVNFTDGDHEAASDAARAEHWRWTALLSVDDPLHPNAPHFATPSSPLVFQMQSAPIASSLLLAGYVAAGHYTWRPNAQTGAWKFMSFDMAAGRDGRLRAIPKGEEVWEATCAFLRRMLAEPPPAEARSRATDFGGGAPLLPTAEVWEARLQGEGFESASAAVDAKALLRLGDELEVTRRGGVKRSCEHWRRQLDAVHTTGPVRLQEWNHGVPTSDSLGAAAHVVYELDGKATRRTGGHRRWLSQGKDENGCLVGWEGRLAVLQDQFDLDDEGYLTSHGTRAEVATLASFPPMLQLLGRARYALADAPVVYQPAGFKARETRVNLTAARASFQEACRLQAQYDITHAFAVDGTKVERKSSKGETFTVVARAAVAHTGHIVGGRLAHADQFLGEFSTTFLAEKAAVNDALAELPAGARAVIWLDATSPAHAQRSFTRATARRKQQMYAAGWHAATAQLMNALEVVVMHWQTSHVGEPMNEWADVEAGAAAQGEDILPIVPLTHQHVSMVFPTGIGGPRRWADLRADKAVAERLRACSAHTVFRAQHDVYVTGISSLDLRLQASIRARRCFHTDLGRPCSPYQRLRRHALKCPWCDTTAPDWAHFCFECEGAECSELREDITAQLRHLQEVNDQTLGDAFINTATTLEWLQFMRYNKGCAAATFPWVDRVRRCALSPIIGPQRVIGGLFGFDSPPTEACKVAVTGATHAILRLLHFALDGCDVAWGEELRMTQLVERVWGRFAVRLKVLVVEGGPVRAAALRDCAALRSRLVCMDGDGSGTQTTSCRAKCLAIWEHERSECPSRSAVDPSFAARAALNAARALAKAATAARVRAPAHQPRIEAAAAAARTLDEAKVRMAASLAGARRARFLWRIASWTLHAWHRARRRINSTKVPPGLRKERAIETACGHRLRAAEPFDDGKFFRAHIAASFNACWRARGKTCAAAAPSCPFTALKVATRRWLAGDTVHGGAPRDDGSTVAVEIAHRERGARRGSKRQVQQAANARVQRGWQADRRGAWGGARIVDTRRRGTSTRAIDALVQWPGTWELREGQWVQTASTGTFETWLGVNATNFPDREMREAAWAAYKDKLAGVGVDAAEERELQRLERRAPADRNAMDTGEERAEEEFRREAAPMNRNKDEAVVSESAECGEGADGGDGEEAKFSRRGEDRDTEEEVGEEGGPHHVAAPPTRSSQGEDMDTEEEEVVEACRPHHSTAPLLAQTEVLAAGVTCEAIPVATFIVWLRFVRDGNEALRVALSDTPPPCEHPATASGGTDWPLRGVWFAEAGEGIEHGLGGGMVGRRYLAQYPHVYALLQDPARTVLRIGCIVQFDAFVTAFCDSQGRVNWEEVAACGVGGIFISVHLQERRHLGWYAEWAAGTGLMLHGAARATHIASRASDGAYYISNAVPVEALPPRCLPQEALDDAARLASALALTQAHAQDMIKRAVRARALAHLHFCRMHNRSGASVAVCAAAARERRVTDDAVRVLLPEADERREAQAVTIELGLIRCPACDTLLGSAQLCPACAGEALGITKGQAVCALDIFCTDPTMRHFDNVLQEVNVVGDGSCWLYSIMAVGGAAPHAFTAAMIPRSGSWRPSATTALARVSGQERTLERAMRHAVRTWVGANGGAERFYRAEGADSASAHLERMAEGSPTPGLGDGIHGGANEYTALADLTECVLFSVNADNGIGTRFEPGCPGSQPGARGKQRRATLTATIEYAILTGNRLVCLRYFPRLVHWRPLIPTQDDGRVAFDTSLRDKLAGLPG